MSRETCFKTQDEEGTLLAVQNKDLSKINCTQNQLVNVNDLVYFISSINNFKETLSQGQNDLKSLLHCPLGWYAYEYILMWSEKSKFKGCI